MSEMQYRSLPADNLRAQDDSVTLTGHFSVFNEFYPVYERGKYFLERIAPGAFDETLRTNKPKVLFEHGYDAQIGRKPIGTAKVVHEDSRGAYYEAELFHESSYVKDLIPAIRAGEFAASFGFMVEDNGEIWDNHPERSSYNPEGLPERTITKVRVSEFSVVLDPANPSATAGIRSLTDKYSQRNEVPVEEPTLEDADDSEVVVDDADGEAPEAPEAPSEADQVEDAPEGTDETEEADIPSARSTDSLIKKETPNMENRMTVEERAARVDAIQERLEEIANDYDGEELPFERQAEWDELVEERDAHERGIRETERRRAALGNAAADGRAVESGRSAPNVIVRPDNLHDYTALRSMDPEARARKAYDNAQRIIDRTNFAASTRSKEDNQEHVTKLLNGAYVDKGALSEQLMRTSHPKYKEAFARWMASGGTETRDMNIATPADGGYGVPFDLDPTWILTTDGAVNPLRQIARVEKVSGTHIRLITTAGVTVNRDGEAVAVDGTPSPQLANPEFNAGRVSGYVPFSIELGDAYAGLEGQLTRALAEAKAEEEAATFVTGSGNGLTGVQGLNQLFVENAGSEVETGAAGVFDSGDIYALDDALAPRHRANASFLASKPIYNAVRQLGSDTDGGDLWVRLAAGLPPELIGYSAREMSEMQTVTTSTTLPFLILGDFQKYLIVDRIGMRVVMDDLVKDPTTNTPTGQRALVAFWWNGGGFIDGNAFRGLSNNDGA